MHINYAIIVVFFRRIDNETNMTHEIIYEQGTIKFIEYSANDAMENAHILAEFRSSYFSKFPYLYKADSHQEMQNCNDFAGSQGARIIVLYDDTKAIGIATHIPFMHAWDGLHRAFHNAHLNLKHYHYFAESIIHQDYRGMGLSKFINAHIEQYAKNISAKYITAMTVIRKPNHPMKPLNYIPFENYMHHFNYAQIPNVNMTISWPTMPHGHEEKHSLIFWQKIL